MFSAVVRAVVVVTKLVTLGFLFLTSFILVLRVVAVAALVLLDISPLAAIYFSVKSSISS